MPGELQASLQNVSIPAERATAAVAWKAIRRGVREVQAGRCLSAVCWPSTSAAPSSRPASSPATDALIASDRIPTPRAATADDLFRALETLCRRRAARQPTSTSRPSAWAAAGRCSTRPAWSARSTSPSGAGFPLRQRLAAAFEPAVRGRQRCQGAGARRTLAGRRARLGQHAGHGRLDRRRRRHHPRRAPAARLRRATPATSATSIVWPGRAPPCGCGARGCVEGVASGTGLAGGCAAALALGASTSLPPGATAVDIAAAARQGDALAMELFRTRRRRCRPRHRVARPRCSTSSWS